MGSTDATSGFNVVGYVSSNVGVAVSARHYVRLLLEQGYGICILDLDPGLNRRGTDNTFAAYTVSKAEDLKYDITLVFLFIPDYPGFILRPPTGLLRNDRIVAAFVWWELTVLPKFWIEALQMFDVVIAGSPFVRHTLETNLSGVPILYAPSPLFMPQVASSRERFGIPDGTVFLASFEPHSDPERKNPYAVLDAFVQAFKKDEQVTLLIKLNNAGTEGQISPRALVEKIEARCNHDKRVRIFTETLSYIDVLRLYASCDVFVSLHRAEGLGLGPMEAMMIGKPVIATAWSGNMTFMDHTNACLVGYRLIPVKGQHPIYTAKFMGKESSWADPDVHEAAQWMSRLAADPMLRNEIGLRASEDMQQFQTQARRAHFPRELGLMLERLITHRLPPAAKDAAQQRLRKLQFEHSASRFQLLTAPLMRFLERNLLWRFRRQ